MRTLHPQDLIFSHYYDNALHGRGATRIDRSYHHGDLKIIKAEYVPVPFSDHFSLVITASAPENLSRILCPKSKPSFKANPEVVTDKIFQDRLREAFARWIEVKMFDLDVLPWWEWMVKPGIKKLLVERGKEITKEKKGALNLLLLQQGYLIQKLQAGQHHRLGQLLAVQRQIQSWYQNDCKKVKLQARTEEIKTAEPARIYHHQLHRKRIKRRSILGGHLACTEYLELT